MHVIPPPKAADTRLEAAGRHLTCVLYRVDLAETLSDWDRTPERFHSLRDHVPPRMTPMEPQTRIQSTGMSEGHAITQLETVSPQDEENSPDACGLAIANAIPTAASNRSGIHHRGHVVSRNTTTTCTIRRTKETERNVRQRALYTVRPFRAPDVIAGSRLFWLDVPLEKAKNAQTEQSPRMPRTAMTMMASRIASVELRPSITSD